MNIINPLPDDVISDVEPDFKNRGHNQTRIRTYWKTWFQTVYNILFANTQSGTTSNRPTKNLWVGRRYFDTTLGKPVYLKSISPTVWVDGVGTVS